MVHMVIYIHTYMNIDIHNESMTYVWDVSGCKSFLRQNKQLIIATTTLSREDNYLEITHVLMNMHCIIFIKKVDTIFIYTI